MTTYDILIVGGGIVGQSQALALAKQTSLSIAIFEATAECKAWALAPYSGWRYKCAPQPHHRVSAISLASKRIFEHLNVWESIKQKRISPFNKMRVTNANGKSELAFDSKEIAEEAMGYIIENNVIQSSLSEKIKENAQIKVMREVKLSSFSEKEDGIQLKMDDGRCYQGKCLIAADGFNSWVRKEAKIAIDEHDYQQSAIVATIRTSLSHQKIARQVFLKDGPLAFLPLSDQHLSSIVWSLPQAEAHALMKLDDDAFRRELQQASFADLGEILDIDKRYQFGLKAHQAKQYVQSRLALVGDSAHTIHPLAGQGLNMGLLDAASLAEVITDAHRLNRDFFKLNTLRRYERWRRADNLIMQKAVHAIFNLFHQEKSLFKPIRGLGFKITNQVPSIKNLFMRYAVGNRDGLPKMADKESCQLT